MSNDTYAIFSDFLYKNICCGYSFELHQQVDAIQMGTHNICLYKEVARKYTYCNLKTTELLDCVLIGVCAVIRSNTVSSLYFRLVNDFSAACYLIWTCPFISGWSVIYHCLLSYTVFLLGVTDFIAVSHLILKIFSLPDRCQLFYCCLLSCIYFLFISGFVNDFYAASCLLPSNLFISGLSVI